MWLIYTKLKKGAFQLNFFFATSFVGLTHSTIGHNNMHMTLHFTRRNMSYGSEKMDKNQTLTNEKYLLTRNYPLISIIVIYIDRPIVHVTFTFYLLFVNNSTFQLK